MRSSIDLARHWNGKPRKAREIATSMDIPPDYLKQVLADLVAGGVFTSTAGPQGGYQLARSPEDVTLLRVVEAAEGTLVVDHCVLRGGPCDWQGVCPVHETWSKALDAFAESLAATTLAELARIDHEIEHGGYAAIELPHVQRTPRRGTRT